MVNFSGVGSGIDWGNITRQLVAAEKIPERALEDRKSGTTRQISLLGDLGTKLRALSTVAQDLDEARKFNVLSATTSDDTRVRVTSNDGAERGTYDLVVNSLATTQSSRSRTFTTRDAGALGTGSVTFTVGTGTPVTVDYDATDSLDAIAQRINTDVTGVRASVLYDGTQYRLMVNGTGAGTAGAVTFAETGDPLGLSTTVTATDASVTINGTTITRNSNTISDAITGVTLDLRSVTPTGGASTRVSLASDPAGFRAKVDAYVKAVNDVRGFINGQLGSQILEAGSSLRGDTTLQGLQRQLSGVFSRAYTSNGTTRSLAALGIKTDQTGTMSVDATAFDAARVSDPDGLSALFLGTPTEPGLGAALKSLTDDYTRATTGVLANKQSGLQTRIKSIDDRIAQIEERASSLETRLRKQFSAADTTISGLNSQASYLTALFK